MTASVPEDDAETQARKGFVFTAAALVVLFLATFGTQVLGTGSDLGTLWHLRWRVYANMADRQVPAVYREVDGRLDRLTEPVGAPDYLWGVSHKGYADLYRLLSAVGAVPAKAWRDCDAARVTDCRAVVAAAPEVSLRSPFPGVCGPVVFAIETAADWGAGTTARVRRIASAELTCTG